MELKVNPIQKLDVLLKHIKHVGLITEPTLILYLELRNVDLKGSELDRSLKQLIDDGYVYITDGCYAISVKGWLFYGYEKQITTENALACRKNIRDFVLSWGTALAGVAATLLLLWETRHLILRLWHYFF